MIGRMYHCSPKRPEMYALRLLLLHVPGAQGYLHLQQVDGVDKGSFREAAKARGLTQNIEEVDHIIKEMMDSQCGWNKQCELFALLLVWHDIGDARELRGMSWQNIVARELAQDNSEDNKTRWHNNALRLIDTVL